MALDPITIQKEREKIEQVQLTGIIRKSDLVEDTECIDTYSTTVDTGEGTMDFQYYVLSGECETDSIYDIVKQPFAENTTVRLSLAQEEPPIMISGNVLFTPEPFLSFPTNYIFSGALFLIVGILVGVLLKRKNKNINA